MLNAHKEGALIIFDVDGRRCSYNLSTHKTVGFSGRVVKSLDSQLKDYSLSEVIKAFDDERYQKFLNWISVHGSNGTMNLRNPASVFSRIGLYSWVEQYFAAGIYNVDPNLTYKLSDVPKPLRQYGMGGGMITTRLCDEYKRDQDASVALFRHDGNLSLKDKTDILLYGVGRYNAHQHRYLFEPYYWQLIHTFGYNATALTRYIDRIVTYEALCIEETVGNLIDYACMMQQISPKYDKFPRNLLTTHQIAVRNYNRLKVQYDAAEFAAVRKPELEAVIGDYAFIYPKTVDEIKDEAVQQNNCVASYIKRVLEGRCDIMFMRNKYMPEKSLVTLEVVNGSNIVQAYQRYNTPCTLEQNEAIKRWEELQAKRKEEVA